MEYVNKKTGEVYQVEEVGLANICDGDLDFCFKSEFKGLVEKLLDGDKGSINIVVKVCKGVDVSGDAVINVETQLGTKYPKIRIDDKNKKKITDEGKIVQRVGDDMFGNDEC